MGFQGFPPEPFKFSPRKEKDLTEVQAPMAELVEDLKRTRFFVFRESTEAQAQKPGFAKRIAGDLAAMMPLIHWLEKASKQW